jgi:hypothetical protein
MKCKDERLDMLVAAAADNHPAMPAAAVDWLRVD